jgi:signal transduction histidine kinase
MNPFLTQIITLLTTQPGNLVYHLVVAFYIAGALQGAISQWRDNPFPQTRRLIIGLSVLLTAQLVLFAISGLAWQGLIPTRYTLPVLDRAVSLLGLVWVIWLWAFPEKSSQGDAATLLLTVLVLLGLFLGVMDWSQVTINASFNASQQEMFWQIASIAMAVLGGVVLGLRRANAWLTGLLMMLILFAGHLMQLVLPHSGDYPGFVRLFSLAGYALLLPLPHRFSSSTTFQPPVPQKRASNSAPSEPVRERRRFSTDPKAFASLLKVAASTTYDETVSALARSIAQAVLADLCFLVFYDENMGTLNMVAGYDLIREEHLPSGSISESTVPLLSNAIKRKRPLRMPASSTSPDVKGLSDLFGLTSPGNLMSVPIKRSNGDAWGAVLVLAPYSERLWSSEDQSYISNVSELITPILERAERLQALEEERRHLKDAYEALKLRVSTLEQANQELSQELERVRQAVGSADEETIAALRAAQEEAQNVIARLRAENESLRKGVALHTDEQLEAELRLTLEEVARLQNALAEANMRILELERMTGRSMMDSQAEIIAAIAQELRQPMSSIIGYTDLLLGESVGILGALQRKFVERIKASTERIGSLIDDLIQIIQIETGKVQIHTENVDLNLVIDNALAQVATEMRKKNISLEIDIPKNLQSIPADKEALQQILIHLLQNAIAVSPEESTIRLHIQIEEEDGQPFVLLQITDQGGGIASEDLPRVFSRIYRADNPLIAGVGDNGVGLSIAKTLAEAQKGRIWVESKPNEGATFSVLLPLNGKH